MEKMKFLKKHSKQLFSLFLIFTIQDFSCVNAEKINSLFSTNTFKELIIINESNPTSPVVNTTMNLSSFKEIGESNLLPPPAPANDNCSGATAFPAIPTTGACSSLNNQSNNNSTNSGVTPTGTERDRWLVQWFCSLELSLIDNCKINFRCCVRLLYQPISHHLKNQFISYPELNHLLMSGTGKSKPEEYDKQGNVSEKIILDMTTWIKEHSIVRPFY